MTIEIYTKSVYGAPQTYVLDAATAQLFTQLLGTKTLTAKHLLVLGKLGFEFKKVPNPNE